MSATLTRRDFLARGAATAAALAAAGCGDWREPPPPGRAPARVVVAGAGMAGLSVAYELVRRGHDVTVLEARDRPGGRVLTLRGLFDDGLHVEAGAVFVPDAHHHTIGYAAELGVPLLPAGARRRGAGQRWFVRGKSVVVPARGEAPRWPLSLAVHERGHTPAGLRARYLQPVLDTLGDPLHPAWPGEGAAELDAVTLAQLLRSRGASDGAVALIRLGYLDEWGDGIDRCSALSLLRDLRLLGGSGGASVVEGGTDRLAHAFAARLGERIRYGAAVTGVANGEAEVRVGYRRGGRWEVIEADYLVLAIPFPTLRAVKIEPPFSFPKRRVIEALKTTSITRVYLQVRERCWPPGETAVATDLPVMHVGDATAGQGGPRAVLEAFVTGANARRMAALPQEVRVEQALKSASYIHSALKRVFERGASYAWDDDRWAKGDYAWFAPGELRAFLPHLARPEGRVHFAGDHTSAQPGWMQGALASGIRAAQEIHARATAAVSG